VGDTTAYRTRMSSLELLCHTVASQSGVIAVAHGAGLPVIVPPVGGLTGHDALAQCGYEVYGIDQ